MAEARTHRPYGGLELIHGKCFTQVGASANTLVAEEGSSPVQYEAIVNTCVRWNIYIYIYEVDGVGCRWLRCVCVCVEVWPLAEQDKTTTPSAR